MSPRPSPGALERLLATKEIVIACGPGGVGKTTTAAALAATAAARGRRKVLVITVDPARRLADALGVGPIGNAAVRVPDAAFGDAGHAPKGELWAAMLDMKESWDALVHRHAPDEETAERILANPLYRNVTGRFAQSHEYIAMERLYEIHAEGRYDLLVVDTPPTRNALDFLDAPQRMADFFASGLLRWLIAPSRSRLVSLASRPFYQVADRILGTQFLEEVGEFFLLFQSMYDGFIRRANAVSALLRDRLTTFMLVTTLEAVPAHETERFVGALQERRLNLGVLVANRVLPPSLADPQVAVVAEALQSDARKLATRLAGEGAGVPGDPALVERVLEEVARSFGHFRLVAEREAELLEELGLAHDLVATVPQLTSDVVDVTGLLEVGAHMFAGRERRNPRVP